MLNLYDEYRNPQAENFNDLSESRENDVMLGQVPH